MEGQEGREGREGWEDGKAGRDEKGWEGRERREGGGILNTKRKVSREDQESSQTKGTEKEPLNFLGIFKRSPPEG